MDRNTLSMFGWLVLGLLTISLLLVFASPLTELIVDRTRSIPELLADEFGICTHENTSEVVSWEYQNESKHRKVKEIICLDCASILETSTMAEEAVHFLDASGTCADCRYKHLHEFSASKEIQSCVGSSHGRAHTITELRECTCGEELLVTREEPHSFTNGICSLCMAEQFS